MKKIISTEQMKAARMLLGWDQVQLAKEAGLGIATVRRIEAVSGPADMENKSVQKIRAAFRNVGIKFLGAPGEGPGVRLTKV